MDSSTQKISVATATIVGMNAMIGAGIFSAPSAIASYVGPAGILAYLFVIVAVWFMAISMARLVSLFPEEGSFYLYTKQWAGHIGGIIAITCYFMGLMIAMGLLAQRAGDYLHPVFPALSSHTLGLITLSALVALNMFGVALSQVGQHILIVCTVFPLVATTIMCFLKADTSNLTPFAPYGFGNVFKATRIVIFGFFGFESASSLFHVVKDPKRNVPKALTYSILCVGVIYTLFIASIIVSTPLGYFNNPNILIPSILERTFPNARWILYAIHGSILAAILGTVHSMIWGSSQLMYSILHRIHTPTVEYLVHKKWVTPTSCVAVVGGAIFTTYSTLKNANLFFSFTAVFLVTAFIMSMITLLTIKDEWRSGNNIKTVLGIATALLIMYFAGEDLAHELAKIW